MKGHGVGAKGKYQGNKNKKSLSLRKANPPTSLEINACERGGKTTVLEQECSTLGRRGKTKGVRQKGVRRVNRARLYNGLLGVCPKGAMRKKSTKGESSERIGGDGQKPENADGEEK